MIAKANGYPTKEVLRSRITRHLAWRGTDTVALIWHGYIASLVEWGLIEVDVYNYICTLLPKIGTKELSELWSGEPITLEREADIGQIPPRTPDQELVRLAWKIAKCGLICYPTEEELRNRIIDQLSWQGAVDTVVLLWHGYLTALLEWGLLEIHVSDRLLSLLPMVGSKEIYELCLDEPISPEREAEIDEYLRAVYVPRIP